MADVKTGVSTNRMLDKHYTPLAHIPAIRVAFVSTGMTTEFSRRR